MSTYEIITIIISLFALGISGIALWREILTRKKVDELRDLEIAKLKAEKERLSKAVVYGYINDDCFVIENTGEAAASNIRYEGWDDWCDSISNDVIRYIPPHKKHLIKLNLTMDTPSSRSFKIVWDDESGKDHVWSEKLDLYN